MNETVTAVPQRLGERQAAIKRWEETHRDKPFVALIVCPRCGGVAAVEKKGGRLWCTGFVLNLHLLEEMVRVSGEKPEQPA